MLLPRTLEIKFGEEYSSVYYITIRVLLFYDDAKKKKRKCWRRNVITSYTRNKFGKEYSMYTTLLYMYCYSMTIQRRRRGNVGEEMLLPRTLEIKFGEEYSSIYYITIHLLLFYNNAKKRKRWRRVYMYCYFKTM